MKTAGALGLSKQRSAYWDNIKGFLIALVVFAHCLYAFQSKRTIDIIVDSIYFFHMPAFVFVSGFFSKSRNSRSADSLFKLFTAFLLLTAVHLVMAFAMGRELKLVTPYYSAWYLPALIVWRLATPYFSKVRGAVPIALLAAFLAGFWKDINNSFAFARIISLYPFFLAGYFLSKEKAEGIKTKAASSSIPIGIGLLIAGGLIAAAAKRFLHPAERDFLFNAYSDGAAMHALIRAAIIAVASLVIIGIMFLGTDRRIPILTKAGKNSLAVYLIHRPITLILNRFVAGLSWKLLIGYAFVFTLLSLLIMGSDLVSKGLNGVLNAVSEGFLSAGSGDKKNRRKRILALALVLCVLAFAAAGYAAKHLLH
jgi:Fucose 4-O-acetylase and related acetyltransferases